MEDEIKVVKIRRFNEGAGRTGKGTLEFYSDTSGYRVVDVEDIITISRTPQLHRR